MPSTLLGSILADCKNHNNKGVSMATRGLLSLFREINPLELKKKDRGKAATMSIKEFKAKKYGEIEAIEGTQFGMELMEPSDNDEMEHEGDEIEMKGKEMEDTTIDSEKQDDDDDEDDNDDDANEEFNWDEWEETSLGSQDENVSEEEGDAEEGEDNADEDEGEGEGEGEWESIDENEEWSAAEENNVETEPVVNSNTARITTEKNKTENVTKSRNVSHVSTIATTRVSDYNLFFFSFRC